MRYLNPVFWDYPQLNSPEKGVGSTMILKCLGHACFIVSDRKRTVIFDPFVHVNPETVLGLEQCGQRVERR